MQLEMRRGHFKGGFGFTFYIYSRSTFGGKTTRRRVADFDRDASARRHTRARLTVDMSCFPRTCRRAGSMA